MHCNSVFFTKIKVMAIMLGVLLFIGTASASGIQSLNPDEVARHLQQTYEKTRSISALFKQITSNRMSRRVRRGSGTVVIEKPGKMRWDYGPPEPQILICDGKTITMYLANAGQMIVGSAEEYLRSDVTYAFFTGNGDITREFDAMAPDVALESDVPADGHTVLIKLVPKKVHPQIEYLHVWVDTRSYLITRLQIVDQFGSVTDLTFSGIVTNRKIGPDYFTFTPPPDTEIIKQ